MSTQRRSNPAEKDLRMSSAQRHDHPGRVRPTQTQHDGDRRHNKTVNGCFESEDERYASRRDREGKPRSSARSSKTEAFASTLYQTPATASINRDSRPPSRNAVTPNPYQTNPSEFQLHSHAHLQSSSRTQRWRTDTPEPHDTRAYSHKRPLVTLSRKSSFEHASGAEDNATVPRHLRAQDDTKTSTPVAWSHAENEASTSRRHLERDRDRERDGKYGRSLERANNDHARIESNPRDKREAKESERSKELDRTREADKTREYERSADKKRENRLRTEHKNSSRPAASSVATPDHRIEESNFSDGGIGRPATSLHVHRRHRTEDGTRATSSDRRLQSDHSQNAGLPYKTSKSSDAPVMSHSTMHSYVHPQNVIPPATPRVMPVYLPEQKSKTTKSHHERNISLPDDFPTTALTDTEDFRRRYVSSHVARLRGHQAETTVQMSQNAASATTTVKQHANRNRIAGDATGTRVVVIGTDIGKLPDTSRLPETSPPKASDVKSDVVEFSRPTTSVQVPTGDKRKQMIEMQHISEIRSGQGTAEPRSVDLYSKPISKSESPKYFTTPRVGEQPTRERSDNTVSTRPSAPQVYTQISGTSAPTSRTSITATSHIYPSTESIPPPPVAQNTHSNATSPSVESPVQNPGLLSRLTSANVVVNKYAHQELSSVPASCVPQPAELTSRPLMLQSKAIGDHGGAPPKVLLAPPPAQPRDNQTTQLPNLPLECHHGSSVTNPSIIVKAVDYSTKKQSAREALLSAVAKNSSTTTHVPSKGIQLPLPSSLTPLATTEPSQSPSREIRQPEYSARAGDASSLNSGRVHGQPKSKPEPTELKQSSVADYDASPRYVPSPSNAVASLKQQLNVILSSKPTNHSLDPVKYSSLSTRSEPSEDPTTQPSTNTTMIHQIQGQLQKLLNSAKPAERETLTNIAPSPAMAAQKSNVTVLMTNTTEQTGIDDQHILGVNATPSSSVPLGNERIATVPVTTGIHAEKNPKSVRAARQDDRPANELPDGPLQSLTRVVSQEERQISEKSAAFMTDETLDLSLKNPQPVTICVWQAKIEVSPPIVIPPYSEGTGHLLQHSQHLPTLAVQAPVSKEGAPAGHREDDRSPALKTSQVVTTMNPQEIFERIEKNIAPQCYIPPLPNLTVIPESSKTRTPANADILAKAAVHPPVLAVPEVPKPNVSHPRSSSISSRPSTSPALSSVVLVKSSPQTHLTSMEPWNMRKLTSYTTPSSDTRVSRDSPAHNDNMQPGDIGLDIKPQAAVPSQQAIQTLTHQTIPNFLPISSPILEPPDPACRKGARIERYDGPVEDQTRRPMEPSTTIPRDTHKESRTSPVTTNPATVSQEPKYIYAHISSSPSVDARVSPKTTSHSPSSNLRPEVSKLPNSSTQGGQPGSHHPHSLPYISEAAVMQHAESSAQPPPGSDTKSSVHRTSPDNSRLSSRNSPVLTKSHDRVSISPSLRADQSQHSPQPRTSTASHKVLNLHPANIRSHPIAHSHSTSPSTVQTSASRLQENVPISGFAFVQSSVSTTPSSVASNRPVLKSSDLPSRVRDAPATTSSLASVILQPRIHPHHSTPSASHNLAVPNTQPQKSMSPPSRDAPPLTNQSRPDLVRPQTSVAQRQQTTTQANPPTASDPQTMVTRTSANKPVPIVTKQVQMMRNISTESESVLDTPSSLANSRPPSRAAEPAPPPVQPHESRRPDAEQNATQVKTTTDPSPNEQYGPKTAKKDEPRSKQRSSSKAPGTRSGSATHSVPALTIKTDIQSLGMLTSTSLEFSGSLALAPFRLVSSHRQRRVSTASLEAVNGTAANTVIGSPTTSIYSQAPPLPPVRDPILATQEWRNKGEAELNSRRKARRHRPGVVFDVAEETPTDYRYPGGPTTMSTSTRPPRR